MNEKEWMKKISLMAYVIYIQRWGDRQRNLTTCVRPNKLRQANKIVYQCLRSDKKSVVGVL